LSLKTKQLCCLTSLSPRFSKAGNALRRRMPPDTSDGRLTVPIHCWALLGRAAIRRRYPRLTPGIHVPRGQFGRLSPSKPGHDDRSAAHGGHQMQHRLDLGNGSGPAVVQGIGGGKERTPAAAATARGAVHPRTAPAKHPTSTEHPDRSNSPCCFCSARNSVMNKAAPGWHQNRSRILKS